MKKRKINVNTHTAQVAAILHKYATYHPTTVLTLLRGDIFEGRQRRGGSLTGTISPVTPKEKVFKYQITGELTGLVRKIYMDDIIAVIETSKGGYLYKNEDFIK